MKMWWCLYRERPQNKETQTEVSFVHYMKHLAPPLTPDPAPQRSDELAGALAAVVPSRYPLRLTGAVRVRQLGRQASPATLER